MTYGEADTARAAIGSGLCEYGLPKVSAWALLSHLFYLFCINYKSFLLRELILKHLEMYKGPCITASLYLEFPFIRPEIQAQ